MRGLLPAATLFATTFAAANAHAICNGRPTDPAGYGGYVYGAATATSYASARVRVHYTTNGAHAPNLGSTRPDMVPDTVVLASDTAEDALTKYASWGYQPVPSDAACASNGGDEKLDVYLVRFAGADGSTVAECSGTTCSSFMLVESTFVGKGYASPAEGFHTVVTHELFHAVQNVYHHDMEPFWAEGTAQWAMKTVHPELQDFERQLPAFFSEPTRSIDAPTGVSAGFLYGSAVWPLFLATRHGQDVIRTIIEGEATGDPVLTVTDNVLVQAKSSLADEYPLFAAWNAATGSLAGTAGYPEAATYPGVAVGALADGVTAITAGLSSYAYRGTLPAPTSVSVETDATRNGAVLVPIVNGVPALDKAAKLPATGNGDVLVVVAGVTSKKSDAPFTIHFGAPAAAAASASNGGCSFSPLPAPSAGFAGLVLASGLLAKRRRRS